MVLKCLINVMIAALFMLLSGCGSHSIKTPPWTKKNVIPVAVETKADTPESLTYPNTLNSDGPVLPNAIDKKSDQPANNIIVVLLQKAQKAFSLQQWLRAQHILEQAIRLDPNESKIFMLYGDVYSQIGLREQAKNMYQRALFLAEENSEIKAAALNKLETIK